MAILLDGKAKQLRREHNNRAWLAWHVAACQRAKKLPALRSMMQRDRPRPQSWQEQAALMSQFALAHNRKLVSEEGRQWLKAR